jgi:hypothetical protein
MGDFVWLMDWAISIRVLDIRQRHFTTTFLLVDSLLTDITKKLQLFADVAVILAKAGIQTSKPIT